MAKTWQEVRDGMIQAYKKYSLEAPEDIIKVFKYDMIETRAGSFGTALTTQVFAAGEVRYLSTYAANRTVALAPLHGEEEISLAALKAAYRIFVPMSAEFSAYCGLYEVWEWDKEVQSVFDQITTREAFVELVSAYANLLSEMNGWILYYFPWNLGDARRQKTVEDIKEMAHFAGLL